jgi:chromate transporter
VVAGVTAGATGAIVGAVFVLGRQSIVDLATAAIALGAFALTWLKWKIPDPVIVALGGLLGIALT